MRCAPGRWRLRPRCDDRASTHLESRNGCGRTGWVPRRNEAPAANHPEGSFKHVLLSLSVSAGLFTVILFSSGSCFALAGCQRSPKPVGFFAGVDDMGTIRKAVDH